MNPMTLDRAVFVFAGLVVLAGVALAHFVSPWWMLLSAFAGANMIQAAFTGFCPAALVFKKLGIRPGQAFR
ncbi:MAG: hypothetical protein ACI9LT_000826 [Pseudoalteromonas distincta]|jgi:hypothetical protein